MSHDYFREIDLNPMINGAPAPITSPLDPRALHYFNFASNGQELALTGPTSGQPRVNASFHYNNQPTAVPPQPPAPIDAILDFSFGPPVRRWENSHDRRHVLVWLDPGTTPPPTGPVLVRVMAWARE